MKPNQLPKRTVKCSISAQSYQKLETIATHDCYTIKDAVKEAIRRFIQEGLKKHRQRALSRIPQGNPWN